jgi:NIMA (never in mitosis gene a)-related kinase
MIGSGFTTMCTISGKKNYEVVGSLGEGSFGNVYLVEDNKGKRYALKKIRIDPFNIEESEKEIDVMKKLSHHNLVKIYDYQV